MWTHVELVCSEAQAGLLLHGSADTPIPVTRAGLQQEIKNGEE